MAAIDNGTDLYELTVIGSNVPGFRAVLPNVEIEDPILDVLSITCGIVPALATLVDCIESCDLRFTG